MGLGEIGSKCQSLALTGGGFLQPAQMLQRVAQVAVGLGVIGTIPDRLPDILDRQGGAAELQSENAQEVQRVGLFGVGLKNLLIEPLSPTEVSRPVKLQGKGKCRSRIIHDFLRFTRRRSQRS